MKSLRHRTMRDTLVLIALAASLIILVNLAKGETVDVDRLCNAIYWSEGGANTTKHYGIMRKFKTTSPRQACINTINHALRDAPDAIASDVSLFIPFLAGRYCPPSVDMVGNQNWRKNVSYFYKNPKTPKP